MPTGFTAVLCERDEPFEVFALRCARGMVALITMRDEPLDAPIPEEFKPSDYYLKRIDEAKREIARINAMSDAEIEAAQAEEIAKYRKQRDEHIKKAKEIRARLIEMQDRVFYWIPPSGEHAGLKNFMTEQLDVTLAVEGNPRCEFYDTAINEIKSKPYRERMLKKWNKDIEYADAEYARECVRERKRTEWVKALRESLRND
jgi:hypothetical protein